MNNGLMNQSGIEGVSFPQEQYPDPNAGVYPSIDSLTKNIVYINHNHMEIHDGGRYYACDYVTGVASGVTYTYIIKTGDESAHFIYGYSASSEALVSLYEGTTYAPSGNDYNVPLNVRNRCAIDSSGAANTTITCHVSGSITSNGILLDINDDQAGALGSGGSPTYPPDRDDNEWILKPNTTYSIQLKTFGSGEHWSIWFDIYEI